MDTIIIEDEYGVLYFSVYDFENAYEIIDQRVAEKDGWAEDSLG